MDSQEDLNHLRMIQAEGWFVTPPMIEPERLDALSSALDSHPGDGKRGGIRNLLGLPDVQELSVCRPVRALDAVECLVERGGILPFRPLLLHASSPASRPDRRRVVHLEFASFGLPVGLSWRWKL